jgi:AcrR family transcriptional regulator
MEAVMRGQQPNDAELFSSEQKWQSCPEKRKTMSDKALDRRIQKTLQLLQNALGELIAEKEYDDITIQELLDRANVGRSTFYAHFENKDQLLRSILTLLNDHYEAGIRRISEERKTYTENSDQMPFRVLQFVEQNHRLFRAMLGKAGHSSHPNPLHDYLYTVTQEHFRQMMRLKRRDTTRLELAAQFYTSAFIGALIWWLENDRVYPAEVFGQMINQMTLPGLQAFLELEPEAE